MVCWFMWNEVSGGLVWLGGGLACLTKEVEPTPSSHWGRCTLIRCAGTRDPCMQQWVAQQSDRNPTLDVSTRLRVGLLPLGGKATSYPFQGSCRLHPQKPVHRGDKGGEVLMLLEASLQIHLLFPPFCVVEALFRSLFLVRQCSRHAFREHCMYPVARGPG